MSVETVLAVESVSKSTENGIILSEVTFSLPKKGVHGLLAPRGAGKTTLLKILAGWDDSFEGDILLGEVSLAGDALTRKRRLGFLPAVPVCDSSMTVEETLIFVGKVKRVLGDKLEARVREALELVGLSGLSARLVENLNAFERQKLSVAMALVGNPKVLLIDEPTAKLGRAEVKEMWGLIRMLGGVKCVLLATDQYEEALELCDDIILMADGRILAKGTFDELEAQLAKKQGREGMSLSEVYASLGGTRKEGKK